MAEKDITEKTFIALNDVFADIYYEEISTVMMKKEGETTMCNVLDAREAYKNISLETVREYLQADPQ